MTDNDFSLGGRMGGRSQSDNWCSPPRDGECDDAKADHVERYTKHYGAKRLPFEDRDAIDRIKLQIQKGRQNA